MKKKVNVSDSLKFGKVIFEKDLIFKISDYFLLMVMLIAFWRITLNPIFESIKLGHYYNYQNSLLPFLICLFITFFCVYKILKKGKLNTLAGKNSDLNRKICKSFVKEKKWIVLVDNKNQLRASIKHSPFVSHSTEILVLFHKDEIKYQILNFGLFGTYYIIFDFTSSNKYLNEFEEDFINKIKAS